MNSRLAEHLLQFAPDAILLVDASGVIRYANQAVEALFGYTTNEIIGLSVEQLVPQRYRERHSQHRFNFERAASVREMGERGVALYALRKDGREFPAEIRLAPLPIEGVFNVVAVIRDTTERHRILRELEQARDEANKANQAKSRFLATASHDLRQPLQSLRLLTSTLRQKLSDPAMQAIVNRQVLAIEAMSDLLNALLDISKLESGTIQPDVQQIEVAQIFTELREQFDELARAKGLELDVKLCDDRLLADPVLLRQLLHNLVANALKYTDSGRVCVRCDHTESRLCIDVEDTGIGIPQQELPTIFNEFYQLEHRGRRRQGIGLGLAIVRHICNLLDYQVEVSSKVGAGTLFRVHIPLSAYLPAAPVQPSATPATGAADLGRPVRVLVVEDDDSVREALLLALEIEGFDPVAAASAEQAVELVNKAQVHPDLVISDYHLGSSMTGVDALARLRQVLGTTVPAVFLSGDTSSAMKSVREFPRSELLRKPVDLRQLAATARELLIQSAERPSA